MKTKDLEIIFTEYCKKSNLTIERSRLNDGQYITAKKGTVFLMPSDPRAGKMWAVMENSGSGTISPLYGFVSIDNMAGWLKDKINTLVIVEIATIAAIMSKHCFDELYRKGNRGAIECYEIIGQLSKRFYCAFKKFNWEKMKFPNGKNPFPMATGFEDMIVYWASNVIINEVN